MKTAIILSVLAFSLLLASCGNAVQPPRNDAAKPVPPAAQTGAAASPGQVSIRFDFQRMQKRASDQLAVWIEDAQGKHVRTLLTTKFTAGGGYQKRPEALPHWQKSFQPAANAAVLDAVTAATPQSGRISLVWDCRDQAGAAVAAGDYVYKVEANIEWGENRPLAGQGNGRPGRRPVRRRRGDQQRQSPAASRTGGFCSRFLAPRQRH